MGSKRYFSLGLIMMLVMNILFPATMPGVWASPTAVSFDQAHLQINVANQVDAVLGKTVALNVTLSNTYSSAFMGDATKWAYNVGLELELGDGLEVADTTTAAPTSSTVASGSGKQTVYWQDIKDLAPGETFTFTVDVKQRTELRVKDANDLTIPVQFGDAEPIAIRAYAGSIARDLYYNPAVPTAAAASSVHVVPYEITVSSAGKHVKGAGAGSGAGDNWESFGFTVTIVNNELYATDLIGMTNVMDSSFEEPRFIEGPPDTAVTTDTYKRVQTWNTLNIPAGGARTIQFDTSIFNNEMNGQGENAGFVIRDNTTLLNTLSFSKATVHQTSMTDYPGKTLDYTAVAKDIVVSKKVGGTVGYGNTLTYTIAVQTNQYYPIDDVQVNDTIGDGQTFVQYTATPGSATILSPSPAKQANGVTLLAWDLGTLAPETVVTLQYETLVDANWTDPANPYSGNPIVAGDWLVNEVTVTGDTYEGVLESSIVVTDSDGTRLGTSSPGISGIITKVGSQIVAVKQASVTVGDTVDFEVTYKAASLPVKQHNVQIFDYLPVGVKPVDTNSDAVIDDTDVAAYTLNGTPPHYNSADNFLFWDLSAADIEAQATFAATIHTIVQNDSSHVAVDKASQNLVKLSHTNTIGEIKSVRDTAAISYVEPNVSMTRSVNKTSVNGGEAVTQTITLINNGKTAAHAVSFQEALPPELDPATLSSVSGPAGYVYTPNGSTPTFSSFSIAPNGGTAVIVYTIQVTVPAGAGRDIQQGSSWTYHSTDGGVIDRTYNGSESLHKTMAVKQASITKTAVDAASGDTTKVRIGDWVVYRISVTVPTNDETYQGTITDTLPANEYAALDGGSPVVFSSYTGNGSGIGLINGETAVAASNKVTISGVPVQTGAHVYNYYVKTIVQKISSGTSETHQSKAKFDWKDLASGGASHSVTSGNATVNVYKPNLTAAITPASVNMVQHDSQSYTLTITNNGQSPAYDFTPAITIPDGFSFTAGGGTESAAGSSRTMTFAKQSSLSSQSGSNTVSFPFSVRLDQVKGSGSVQPILGTSGIYFTTHDSYVNDTDGDSANDPSAFEKLTAASAQSNVHVPSANMSNTLVSATSGSTAAAAPGDVLTYQVSFTVPGGTTAYNVKLIDTFASLSRFDIVSKPAHAAVSGNTLTMEYGLVDASAQAVTKTETIVLRAKADGSAPGSGSFTQLSGAYTSTAYVTWNTIEDNDGTALQTGNQMTSIDISQPSLTLAVRPIANAEFSSANEIIPITLRLSNTGAGEAKNAQFTAVLPEGIDVSSISDGGSFDASTRTIAWSGLNVAPAAHKDVTFQASLQPHVVGAGKTALPVLGKLVQYQSTAADAVDQQAKLYTPGQTDQAELSVAKPALTAIISGSTNGGSTAAARPGDIVTYTLTIAVPTGASAYDAALSQTLSWTEADVQTVALDGTPVVATGGRYPLGTLSGVHTLTVTAKIKSDTEVNPKPYTASYTPNVTYFDAPVSGSAASLTASPLNIQVVEPALALTLTALNNKTAFEQADEALTFTATISNAAGNSTAYDGAVTFTLPAWETLESVGAANGTISSQTLGGFVWQLPDLGQGQQEQVSFTVKANANTAANTQANIQAVLNAYYSLDSQGGKVYGPLQTDKATTVTSAVYLDGTASASTTAGKDVTFFHTLKNPGAGQDDYQMMLQSIFDIDVYLDNVLIAKWGAGSGAWTEIAAPYAAGQQVAIPLNGGESRAVKLVVHVPVTAGYDNQSAHILTLSARGAANQLTAAVQDQLTVLGTALNGWNGAQPLDQWAKPVYKPGDAYKWNALSSVDAQAVKATFTHSAGNEQLNLKLANESTYVQDGYKLWSGIARLPDGLAAGSYEVVFTSLDEQGLTLETESAAAASGFNNSFDVVKVVHLTGTVTSGADGSPIAGALVQLTDLSGTQAIAQTYADSNGSYEFLSIPAGSYEVQASAAGFGRTAQAVDARPGQAAVTVITANLQLTSYLLQLSVDPTSIVGDGVSTANLTATVTDAAYHPLAGVAVQFSIPQGGAYGSFPAGAAAVTDGAGKATVTYRSADIEDILSVRVPLTAVVDDPAHGLHAEGTLLLTFEPGAISGVVTEWSNGQRTAVAGAQIGLAQDFDHDGVIDFSAKALTKADGSYTLGVPRGETSYELTVRKPVDVGGQLVNQTYRQTAYPGVIDGTASPVYPAERSLSGTVLRQKSDGTTGFWSAAMLSRMNIYLKHMETQQDVLDNNGSRKAFPVGADSVFNAVYLPAGHYEVELAFEVAPGKELVLNRHAGALPIMDLTGSGELQIIAITVHPYSLVYDANTGQPLVGPDQDQAHVQIFYADTSANIQQGLTPNQPAVLPSSYDAAMQNDLNPQDVDDYGHYQFFVTPQTDYYIQVSRPGYLTYRSGTIHVGTDMPRFDVPMLGGTGNATLTGGRSVTFPHVLTNGRNQADQYQISVHSPYPVQLSTGSTIIATGHPDHDAWVWSSIHADYKQGNEVRLPLVAGHSFQLDLQITVPVGTPATTVAEAVYLRADSSLLLQDHYELRDYINVVEAPLDGWTGQSEAADWTEPVAAPSSGFYMAATSSVNAISVKARYTTAGVPQAVELSLQNGGTFVQDGYKKWAAMSYYLPDHMDAGETFVTFEAWNSNQELTQSDMLNGPYANNNTLFVVTRIDLGGTVTEQETGAPIAGATVTLYDQFGQVKIAEALTNAQGQYEFPGIAPKVYRVETKRDGYSISTRSVNTLPPSRHVTKIIADFALVQFGISLTANPSAIVGDGMSTSMLTTVIVDKYGNPIAGVPVTFQAPKGTFPNGNTAITQADGTAKVLYRSSRIEGVMSQRIPITATVNDPIHQLYAEAQIVISFEPAVITGIVTTMVNGVSVPVNGAIVNIEKDFDGDGIIDFSGQAVTGPNGKYSIAIPRGNVIYDVRIQKPMTIGGVTKYITFRQKAAAGNITGQGDQFFNSTKTATGIITLRTPTQQTVQFQPAVYQKMKVYLKDSAGNYVTDINGDKQAFPLDANGVFNAQDIAPGEYRIEVAMELGPNEEIIMNRRADGTFPKMEVQQNGEMNIADELIDPYGTITDAASGLAIPGAHVELRYANTARNIAAGRIPNALVNLPELLGFAPNDNHNPQDSDAAGFYAYMVFPYTDYYLVATKPGYIDYKSETIPVETAIVRKDFSMNPILPPMMGGGFMGGFLLELPAEVSSGVDLAVSVMTDRAMYEEGSEITYTLLYKNKTELDAHGVQIQATIPALLQVAASLGYEIKDGVITWQIGDLAPGQTGKIVYKAVAPAGGLTKAEAMVRTTAEITSADERIHLEDDRSTIDVTIFTNRFGPQQHRGYILGYPDGTFKQQRSVTRAEVAAMFARILDLQSTVQGTAFYTDVKPGFWAAGYIEAATRKGLFSGYGGGQFRPDQAITRAELAVVISRYLELEGQQSLESHFTDIGSHWANQEIEQIFRYHIINGYEDGAYRPDQAIIRSETVTMVNRLLNRGPLYGSPQTFPDVGESDWYYGQIQESTSSHEYRRNPDGSEQFIRDLNEPIW